MLDSAVHRENAATVISKIAKNCAIEDKLTHYKFHSPKFFDIIMEQQLKMGKHVGHISKAMTVAMNRSVSGEYGDSPMPELEWQDWEESYKHWLGNLLMNIVISTTGLFEIEADRVTSSQLKHGVKSFSRVYPTDALLEWLEQAEHRIGLFGGFYLPLPVPPRDWTTPQDGGFWTVYGGQKKLIKNFSRGYQEEIMNEIDQLSKTVLPVVNAAQHTAWRVNENVFETLQALWGYGKVVAGLPDRNALSLPVCPKCGQTPDKNHKCFRKDQEIIKAWKMSAAEIHKKNVRFKSIRLAISYGLQTAGLLCSDERFYYVYQLDFRGRLYPCAQLHPQGTDWQKSLLEFADGVELGEHGAKWLAVHIANCWGNDKVSFEARHQWVVDNEEWILECAQNPLNSLEWANADSPFCFLAGCFEWAQYKREGNRFKSRWP